MGTRQKPANAPKAPTSQPAIKRSLFTYLEGLPVTQGAKAGETLRLLGWERRFLRGALAPDVTRAALSLARGNGKSTLVGALACAYLDGPLATTRGDVVVVASSFGQARIVFDGILGHLGGVAAARARGLKVHDNQNAASITNPLNGARIRCIGSDPRRAHGLQPVAVLADEPAQWAPSTSDRMLSALTTAGGKLPGFRVIALGTRPADPEHWFSRWLEGGKADFIQLHAAPQDADPFSPKTWRQANPSLRAFPDLLRAIPAEAKLARADAAEMAPFRALRLNQGTADTYRAELLDAATWEACQTDFPPPPTGRYALGVDLGSGASMSAVAGYWPTSGLLRIVAAFPQIPDLAERERKDHAGEYRYRRMAERGELVTLGERVTDVGALANLAMAMWGPPSVVVADRWRDAELRQALDAAGVPGCELVTRGQGFRNGSEDVRAFRAACIDGRVRSAPSLLLSWALAGAVTVSDPAANAKLAKRNEGGRNACHKDDAVAAAILAVAEGNRRGSSAPQRGLRVLV